MELWNEIKEKTGATMTGLECVRYRASYGSDFSIVSRILDHYIENAGLICCYYGSDVLIDIDNINSYVKTHNGKDAEFYSGFRSMGVDGKTYIETRLESPEIYGDFWEEYRVVLYLVAKSVEDEIIFSLYEIKKEGRLI